MAGSITFAMHEPAPSVGRVVATCIADAADGSFPATAVPAFEGRLIAIETNPGSPAPTDNYDITLVDSEGFDRLGGAGANRDTSTTESAAITGGYAARGEALLLTIVNNAVNSAPIVVTLLYTADV